MSHVEGLGFPEGPVALPDGAIAFVDLLGAPESWRDFYRQFGPDGMGFHKDRLYVTGSDGDRIAVLDLDGPIVDMIAAPPRSVPTNLCFQDDTLWVTFGLSGQLASYQV